MNALARAALAAAQDAEELYELARQALHAGNPFSAAGLLKEAAVRGNATAQYKLACSYACGDLFPFDEAEALKWFVAATQNFSAEAEDLLDVLIRAYGDDPAAQLELGRRHLLGDEVVSDPHRAMAWVQKAAEAGLVEAMEQLALYHLAGILGEPDPEAARSWLRQAKAVESGAFGVDQLLRALDHQGEPMIVLADQLASLPSPYGQEQARAWRERAAWKGEVSAQVELGRYLLEETHDPARAREWLERAAAEDDLEANELLGHVLLHQASSDAERLAALEYLRAAEDGFHVQLEAAEKGNAEAQEAVGLYYLGSKEAPYDLAIARKWLTRAAEQGQIDAKRLLAILTEAEAGDAASQYELALWLARNTPAPRKWTPAAHWAEKAAEQHHPAASRMLANFCLKGLGMPRDLERARALATRAAEHGDAEAHFLLATALKSGEKGAWEAPLRKAAELGHAGAHDILSTLEGAALRDPDCLLHVGYWHGTGFMVEPDRDRALSLYRQAAEQGHEEAVRFLALYDATQQDDRCACYRLGVCYRNATLVHENPERGESLMARARSGPWLEDLRPVGIDLIELVQQRYAFLSQFLQAPEREPIDDLEARFERYLHDQARLLSAADDRRLAADCAHWVLPVYELKFPDDQRPREAICAARAYADGLISQQELVVAGEAAKQAAAEARAAGLLSAAAAAYGAGQRALAALQPLEAREHFGQATQALGEMNQLGLRVDLSAVGAIAGGTLAGMAAMAAARTCSLVRLELLQLPGDVHAIEVGMAAEMLDPSTWNTDGWSPGDMAGTMAKRWVQSRFGYYLRRSGQQVSG